MQRPYPNLLHPVEVELRLLDREKTAWDDRAREPIGRAVRKPPVVLPAQVKWGRIEKPIADYEGVRHDSLGTLTFRWCDLQEAEVTLQRGDKVSRIGNRATDMFLDHFEDAGNYPEYGSTLLVVTLVDRDPGESTS